MAGMRKEYDPNKADRRKRRPIIYTIDEQLLLVWL